METPRTNSNLIVNYIPDWMTSDKLQELFGTIGPMVNCHIVRHKITNQHLGYGFVEYQNPENAERAIEMLNGLRIENKILKVAYARPNSFDETIKEANLHISNLPTEITEEKLMQIMGPFGQIISCQILRHDDSNSSHLGQSESNVQGTSKGVAFVRFNLRSEAEHAIAFLNGAVVMQGSEPISVKFSQVSKPEEQTYILYVRKADGELSAARLWQLFGPLGTIQQIQVLCNHNRGNAKYAFVHFIHYQQALEAVQTLNGYYLDGHRLFVSFKRNSIENNARQNNLVSDSTLV